MMYEVDVIESEDLNAKRETVYKTKEFDRNLVTDRSRLYLKEQAISRARELRNDGKLTEVYVSHGVFGRELVWTWRMV